MDPFKIYISWTGYYPIPSVDDSNHVPIMQGGTFTELDVFENNLTLTKKVDDKLSLGAYRVFLEGDFTLEGDDYDLIKTAIAVPFNDLIIMIEQYSNDASDYVEVYRGTCEIRGDMDDLRKTVKLSKFWTIDYYSDTEKNMNREYIVKYDFNWPAGEGAYYIDAAATEHFLTGMWELDELEILGDRQYSKLINDLIYYSITFNGVDYTYTFGIAPDGNPKEIWIGEVKRAKDETMTETADGITLSFKIIFGLFSDLFDIQWQILNPYEAGPLEAANQFHIRPHTDLINSDTVDYTAQSVGFQKYSYILPKLRSFEKWKLSDKNTTADHLSAYYEYNVLGNNETTISQSSIFTDVDRFDDGTPNLNDSDIIIGLGSRQLPSIDNKWLFASDNDIIGSGTTRNYRVAQAFRMRDWLNNYRQLDEANFNGLTDEPLNPTIGQPSIEQEPFYVDLDLITDLDLEKYYLTSLGTMKMKEGSIKLTSTKTALICVQ